MKKDDIKRLCPTLVNIFLCYILFLSKWQVISVDTYSQIFFLIFSGILGYYVVDFYHSLYKDYFRWPTLPWVILILLCLSFIMFGKPLFLNGDSITYKTILKYIIANFWLFSYMTGFIYFLENNSWYVDEKEKSRKHRWILFSIFVIVWGFVLIVFFPGILTSDSIDQWLQASGVRDINQYHPALMTVFMKFTYQIIQTPALFLILQIMFCAYVLSTFLDYLYQKGLSIKVIYVVAVIFLLLPTNDLLVITVWKDVIYTFSLLWMTYFFLMLSLDEEMFFAKKRNIVYFILCMILCILIRYNGVGPLVFTVLYLGYLLFKRKQVKYLIINVVMIGSVIFVNGPVLRWCGTTSDGQVGSSSYSAITNLVTRSTARAILSNRPVPKYTKKIASAYAPITFLTEHYDPYSADTYGWNDEVDKYHDKLKDKARITNSEAIKAYVLLFCSSPDQVILERLDGMDLIWNMTPNSDSFNHRYGVGIWLPVGLTQKEVKELQKLNSKINANQEAYINDNIMAKLIINGAERISSIYILDNIASRCGLYIGILLILILFTWKHCRNLFVTYIPFISNTATWVLLFAYQAYRYVWYIPVLVVFIFLIICCMGKDNTKLEKKKNKDRSKKGNTNSRKSGMK